MISTSFEMALPWLLVGIGCWLFYQLARQNGRILLRLEGLEEQVGLMRGLLELESSAPAGLAVGSAAPDFVLPDLAGQPWTLASFRGRRLLLIFFDPHCGYCQHLAPDLVALGSEPGDGLPTIVLITTGDPEANRRFIEGQGIRCPVLVQKGSEVASLYQAGGTPTGYLLDEGGTIAGELATGAEALLTIARTPVPAKPETSSNGHAVKPNRGKANRGLGASRINRNGLKAGIPAPVFRLPRLDGSELALEDYRGRRILLIFSDPDCGPCEQIAPRLEEFHRHSGNVQVVMISRGDVEFNRRKVKAMGLTFPVVLQRHWEMSLRYAMFETPVAYLIGEQGILAADVAAGADAIQALMSSTQPAAQKEAAGILQ